MMGSGIFVLPLLAAMHAGPWVAISYLIAGLFVLPAVFSKAELATAMPISGGTYVYVDRSMGPWVGTIAGIGTWLSLVAKTAFALVGLGAYLALLYDWNPLPFTVAVLAILVGLNVVGASKASLLQRIIVIICISGLGTLAIMGGIDAEPTHFSPAFPHGAEGILFTASFVFVSYAGVTKVCSVAEEIRKPQRNIPLGMFSAQIVAMTLYITITTVIVGTLDLAYYAALPAEAVAELLTPVASAAKAIAGETGMKVIAAVAILGLISMCNAGIMSSSRFPFAMARDGLMPDSLSRISPRFGSPMTSILLTGLLLLLAILALPVEELAHLASGFKILLFIVVNLSVILLREAGVNWYNPKFRSPLYPWMQVAGIAGGLVLLVYSGTYVLLALTSTVVVGTLWYLLYARKRADRQSALAHVFGATRAIRETEELESEPVGAPRVIVPIFGDEPAPERLMHLAAAFVEAGVMEVVRLEEIPDQTALGAMLADDGTMDELAREAEETAHDLGILVEFHNVLTHNAKQALLYRAETTDAEWIVMEWPRRRRLTYLVQHPMSWWLDHPPCDLAIFEDRGAEQFKRILVLARPGPYDSLLVHIADRLARQWDGELTFFYPLMRQEDEQQYRHYHGELGALCHTSKHTSLVLLTDNEMETVRNVTSEYDLLVIGTSRERGLRTLVAGSRAHKMVAVAKCSVLCLKTPRHKVHHRLPTKLDFTDLEGVFVRLVSGATIIQGLTVAGGKPYLFKAIATHLASPNGPGADEIEWALWKRERTQSTALPQGVQLATCSHLESSTTRMGVFTLTTPIPFGRPDRCDVDVCIILKGPPSERQTQLWMLDRVSWLVRHTDILTRLRTAATAEDIRALLLAEA